MRRPVLGARDRRALRLGALMVVPVLLVAVVIRPYARALRASSDSLATERTLLARELGVLREAGQNAQLAERERRALAEACSRLFEGGDAVAASAQLASYVAELAEETGVSIDESETRAATDSSIVAAVEVGATGSVLEILQFLRALENGPRLARSDRISISPVAGASPRGGGRVTLRMTVTSQMRRAYGNSTTDSLEAR